MTARQILLWPHPKLSTVCEDVTEFDGDLVALANDLRDTLMNARGLGLAAPQIGVCVNVICVLGPDEKPLVMVNPRWSSVGENPIKTRRTERCLSIPGVTSEVNRYLNVHCAWDGADNGETAQEFSGFTAHAIQHECDHLQGKMMVDHESPLKRGIAWRAMKKLQRQWGRSAVVQNEEAPSVD